jgi:nucleoside-diphosphate-sugar epimerase
MRALVTGGGGFLGRTIVEQLVEHGHNVTSFSRGRYPELDEMGAKSIQGDLQDASAVRQACQGQDVVFHVAAQAGFWGTWDAFYGPNVAGTQNILAACRANGVKKLVYTSSPSVVFDNLPQSGVDESYPYPARYESFYPHTKAIAEQQVIAANGPNLATCSLRPHLIFGPRDNHLLPRVIATAKAGKLPQVGNGSNKVDLTFVKDAARAHLSAAETLEPNSVVAGSVYFISQDEPINLWHWLSELFRELGIPQVKQRVPLGVARAAGAAMEFAYKTLKLKGEPRLTRFLASELAMDHYYDISRARHDFGYRPQIDMAEATRLTIEYLKTVEGGA